MLPAVNSDRLSLAGVLPSCLAALHGEVNRMQLPPLRHVAVLLVDGLGAAALKARSGHARTLAGMLRPSAVIDSGFPTTTAAALATLATGTPPGQHGVVGYTALDPAHDRVVNQLSGWDERLDPDTWQRRHTVFETAAAAGTPAFAIGPERYRDSGFSRAVLRGAEYRAAAGIDARLEVARETMRRERQSLSYVYAPELDIIAHAEGWESARWTEQLEALDAVVRDAVAALRPGDLLLVTADHGVLDVPQHGHVLIDEDPALVDGIRHVAGDPRCLQLHLEPDADLEALAARWRQREGERAWVATRAEATEAGWFGRVDPEVAPRIGDLIVAARRQVAYYDTRSAPAHALRMVGQHGSFSPEELRVPLLRFFG